MSTFVRAPNVVAALPRIGQPAVRVRVVAAAVAMAAVAMLFIGISLYWVAIGAAGRFANDALVYRAGAMGLVSGDPWSLTHEGWPFAAPPLEAMAFLPTVVLPESIVAWLAVAGSAIAAVFIVRRLALPMVWLAFPPLVFGVVLGNPSVIGMAAVLAGFPVIGLILRPQLLFVAGWRAVLVFVALSAVALALRPDFLAALPGIMAGYATASGAPVNFWGSPLMVPAAIALGLLWTVDRTAAAWLVMPAIGPAMGWYGYAMVMPVRSLALGLFCAVPVPGLGAAAITAYALWRFVEARRAVPSTFPGPTVVLDGLAAPLPNDA